jgi:hypothetical protein
MPTKQNPSPATPGSRISDPQLMILSVHEAELIRARRESSGLPEEAFRPDVLTYEHLFYSFMRGYGAAMLEQHLPPMMARAELRFVERVYQITKNVA